MNKNVHDFLYILERIRIAERATRLTSARYFVAEGNASLQEL